MNSSSRLVDLIMSFERLQSEERRVREELQNTVTETIANQLQGKISFQPGEFTVFGEHGVSIKTVEPRVSGRYCNIVLVPFDESKEDIKLFKLRPNDLADLSRIVQSIVDSSNEKHDDDEEVESENKEESSNSAAAE